MFDYVRKLELAASDMGRRVAFKAAAAVVGIVAVGFLIAAFWTLLAYTFGLGSLWASVIVFVVFAIIAAILWGMSKTVKHPVPSTDELKREVAARASLAAEAGMDAAKVKAREVVDLAENKMNSLLEAASFRASEVVNDAEAKVQSFARGTLLDTARKVGLDRERVDDLSEFATSVRESRAGPIVGIASAFAVGLAVASKLKQRDEADPYYAYEDEWDEDNYA